MRRRVHPRASRFRLFIRRSRIHRFGVFAAELIPRYEKVIEYTGERITYKVALERLRKFWTPGRPQPVYFFRLSKNWEVDASRGGSGAELVNHSCDPNLYARRHRGHIYFFSRRAIHPGQELTLDYRFPKDVEKIPCHCGSPKCRGAINRK
ncbi:MAG TPA: SET domain-containing protein-lysine N-methyltransferase [Candidatus Acidoferrum sp.]|nr:SET domain-containing protein-lysine N-methyltransferase [Candidatus Acidoferrum sp.]